MAPFNILRTVFRTLLMRGHAAKYAACVVLACVAAVVVAVPVFGASPGTQAYPGLSGARGHASDPGHGRQGAPPGQTTETTDTTATLVGAGDIARRVDSKHCATPPDNYADDTAKLLGSTLRSLTTDGSLPTLEQARVIAMGDNAYPDGTNNQYANCYDNYYLDSGWSTFNSSRTDWWGQYIDRTMPVLGNHEYQNSDKPSERSKPYFDYFSGASPFKPLPGPSPVPNDPTKNQFGLTFGKGYYSYDLGSWHIVALNSNCNKVGGCEAGSPQGQWLRNDLKAHPAECTLAYFHHPLYATGLDTDTPQVMPFWRILYAKGADVILSGHAHRYERHAPITPEGKIDTTNGIRQFVVGTGGEPGGSEIDYNQVPQGVLQKVIIDKFGIIKLDLDAGSYSWEFIAADGTANGTVMDSGANEQCHGTPGSTGTTPPTVTNVVPGNGASNVPPIGAKVEATFSKAMDANTINGSTFTLTKPDGSDADTNPDPVSGPVAYDSVNKKATLTPDKPLDYSTTYTATVKGGTSGVKDTAGNPLSADEVWTFTTQALPAPSNLTATRSGSPTKQRIDLAWTDNSSSEANFAVERSVDRVTWSELTSTLAANTTSYSDRSVQKKTTYYYRVFAVDSTGTRSAPSNVASATTK
jgi:acid phosphatase type 7